MALVTRVTKARAFATRAFLFNLLTLLIPKEHVLCVMFVLLTLTIPRSLYLSENKYLTVLTAV